MVCRWLWQDLAKQSPFWSISLKIVAPMPTNFRLALLLFLPRIVYSQWEDDWDPLKYVDPLIGSQNGGKEISQTFMVFDLTKARQCVFRGIDPLWNGETSGGYR